MKKLPRTDDTLLVRTDFSDQAAWQALHAVITTPNEDEFVANLSIVDDPEYGDLSTEQIIALAPAAEYSLLIVADKTAITTPEMQLLAVFHEEFDDGTPPVDGRLRVTAQELWSIENNIGQVNMDWDEFADAADDDGVFRGF